MRRKLLNFLFKILIHESSEFCLAFAEKEISKEDGVKEKVMFGEETSSQSVFYFIPINEWKVSIWINERDLKGFKCMTVRFETFRVETYLNFSRLSNLKNFMNLMKYFMENMKLAESYYFWIS